MANQLNVNVEGRIVVIDAMFHEGASVTDRLFYCACGSGCYPTSAAMSITGMYLTDGEETRISGDALERLATVADMHAFACDQRDARRILATLESTVEDELSTLTFQAQG